jgi:hypothetical protein
MVYPFLITQLWAIHQVAPTIRWLWWAWQPVPVFAMPLHNDFFDIRHGGFKPAS